MSLINDAVIEMRNSGLLVKNNNLVLDGQIKRIPTIKKPTKNNAWYVGSTNIIGGSEYICITYSDFATGEKKTFTSWENNIPHSHKKKLLEQISVQKKSADEMNAKAAHEAAAKSKKLWVTLDTNNNQHPYLIKKNIQHYGLRFGKNYKGSFIAIPIYDIEEKYKGMQRIYETLIPNTDRDKEFDYGMSKKGGHFVIGQSNNLALNKPVLFVEGYATGASLFEATGYATIVCFDAGNLCPVVEAYRTKYPNHIFIVCADNDAFSDNNVGLKKATYVAEKFSCVLVFPEFKEEHLIGLPTDFNDFHNLYGLEHTKKTVDSALEKSKLPGIEHRKIDEPRIKDRPCFFVSDDFFYIEDKNKKPGLYYLDTKEVGKDCAEVKLVDYWVCNPFYVEAISSDNKGHNFGRLIRFLNAKKDWCSWIMPMSFLASQSSEKLFEHLLDKGLTIDPSHKKLLSQYIHTYTPKRHVETVSKTGWHESSFVLPDRTFGHSDLYYQTDGLQLSVYQTAGSLDDWRNSISRYCPNNPLMMLFVSTAFAGPLIEKVNATGGGIHLYGDSSTGKTTLLSVARSIWGDERFNRSWKATANGIEGAAMIFNDTLLALDEISEADPREIGAITYSLFNGQGKQRAHVSGKAKEVQRWRAMVLSTGEISLEDQLSAHNLAINAGQELRLVSLPVSAKFGVFDDLHSFENGRQFSDALMSASKKFFGVAGQQFLQNLVNTKHDFLNAQIQYEQSFGINALSSQVGRVAKRFALIAHAGELATRFKLTGWMAGEATAAAIYCFNVWRQGFSPASFESDRILQAVSDFVDKWRESRFVSNGDFCANRAGYLREKDGVTQYLFNRPGLEDALKGMNFKRGLEALKKAGWLLTEQNSSTTQIKIDGKNTRFYVITFPEN